MNSFSNSFKLICLIIAFDHDSFIVADAPNQNGVYLINTILKLI